MTQPYSRAFLERSIDRYVRALDSGDLDEIATVLHIAEESTELDQIIEEINWTYAEEMELSSMSLESAQIRTLLQEHFPSAFGQPGENLPITVSEVAAHLVANRLVPRSDQESSLKFLNIHHALPDWLSLLEIRKLIQQFGYKVSDRFIKAFRDAAIQMSMGRGQAQMAATRRKTSRRYPHRAADTTEENNDSK
jgi:hypothetical protein